MPWCALICCHWLSDAEALSVLVKSAQRQVQEGEGASWKSLQRESKSTPVEVTAGAELVQAARSGDDSSRSPPCAC